MNNKDLIIVLQRIACCLGVLLNNQTNYSKYLLDEYTELCKELENLKKDG